MKTLTDTWKQDLNDAFMVIFEEKNGAQMSDFSSFDALFNYQNTLTRRQEAYHAKFLQMRAEPKKRRPTRE